MTNSNKIKKCDILGVKINVTNMSDTVKYIQKNINSLRGKYICVSNVHTTVMAYESKDYMHIQNSGIMALPDGGPLSLISRLKGFKKAERVTGPDLMGEIFKISEKYGYKHYFYGSTEETLIKLEEKLKCEFPKIKIVGKYSPPFRSLTISEMKIINKNINESKADFVWVGLGAPKQEVWMYNNQEKVNGLMIGVGAGFDYYAGNIKRAPIWMQKLSLEWVYRLMQDPKRLFKRYLLTNIKFIYRIIITSLKGVNNNG